MLLAFDLDNTLVTHDQRLPKVIARAIGMAREAGHVVTVLTGRTRRSAQPFLEQLELSGPYSVNHGALVLGEGDAILRQSTITSKVVRALLERYQTTPQLEYSCIVDDVLYVKDPLDDRWHWAHTVGQRLTPFAEFASEVADKLVFSCPASHSARIHQEIRELHPDLLLYLWDNHFLEITGADAHKGAALELIANTLGFTRDETVAFGDGVNDVTMLEWAGHGVAVGPHAYPEVLAAAAEHIAPPEEHGVARWLEQNLL
jgi:Cof subfamily protein (haloacid dehalogenase superfamily)